MIKGRRGEGERGGNNGGGGGGGINGMRGGIMWEGGYNMLQKIGGWGGVIMWGGDGVREGYNGVRGDKGKGWGGGGGHYKINLASRINILTKFHKDWMKTVTSTVYTNKLLTDARTQAHTTHA
ncbi:hypothetical protein DPMN_019309 [Dreissena polymorpha]|uniref:Uncharacterized protein n=1 Tax=Dreissena polymorpha TaxID=45954 RepID=A0A9D4NK55_DREPO|nr:hypothetical protein DPMN_019309 [Dreissena polymorpha]